MVDTICDDKDLVLIVDDEEMIEEMIGALVEEHGCAHASFSDPAEALRYYETNSPRVTLMIADLTMPSLSGPDLVRRALRINPRLPIILVTDYPGEDVPADIPPLVRSTIAKPFTKSELLDAVRTAFGGRARN